jgi:phospholipid/cholesterol/gamma-HCH transport system ATP-binding protein
MILEAVSSMLGSTPADATVPEATHPGAPSLMEADPHAPERFRTKTRKALGERLGRPSRRMTLADRMPAILVRELDAVYDETQVLFDLNFSVHRGEILAILGGSGSGKTTLLKHLIGLLRPSRGRIEISGQDISQLEGDDLALVLKSIGMLFQYSALFNSMTIAQNVALPLREYTDLPEAAIDAIVRLKLALVGLPGVGERLPNELSGGMKKRAALARALALDPDVLFFDEPGSGLDPIAAAALDQLILHLNRSFGTTMVIVTHDLENAFNVAHRILMLDQGKIRKIGTPGEVKASKDPWVASFLARSTALRDSTDEAFLEKLGLGRKSDKTEKREKSA